MTDEEIIALYNARNENALLETKAKFESLCKAISVGIVGDKNDSEEILNDTYKVLWDTIPPKKPDSLKAYICRVAKNLSLKRYEYNSAKKRKSEYDVSLDELGDIVSGGSAFYDADNSELINLINCFLSKLSKEKRVMFLRRYWFADSVKKIAEDNRISEKTASMRLARIRKQLKSYL